MVNADRLIKYIELKKRFQAGVIPTPSDFGLLIDAASAPCMALGITTLPVKTGSATGSGTGLVYNQRGQLSVALGDGLIFDRRGRVTFDAKTEALIREDQSSRMKADIAKKTGYVTQAMFAAVKAGLAIFTPQSADPRVNHKSVDKNSGIIFDTARAGLVFAKPQISMDFVQLNVNNWSSKAISTVMASDKVHFQDNGTFLPIDTLKVFGDTGAFLCFGSGESGNLTSGVIVVVMYDDNVIAAGRWQLDSVPQLTLNQEEWVNYFEPEI